MFETAQCTCFIGVNPEPDGKGPISGTAATGRPNVDISILKVKGDFRAKRYLKIKRHDLKPEEAIDVIGYPGRYGERYVLDMHGGLADWDSINNVTELFPKCELIVSNGIVESNGIMPTYQLSTVIGMSGSPVVVSGEVIGK